MRKRGHIQHISALDHFIPFFPHEANLFEELSERK